MELLKVKTILYQQLELLAEESKKAEDIGTILRIAAEIDRISNTILNAFSD